MAFSPECFRVSAAPKDVGVVEGGLEFRAR